MGSTFERWVASRRTSAAIAVAVMISSAATLVGWPVDSTVLNASLPGCMAMAAVYFVRDNGLGIPAAHQVKVFQAFSTLTPFVGTGRRDGCLPRGGIVYAH